jgi:hypothetical protein
MQNTMNPVAKTKINYTLVNDEVFETPIDIYVYTEKSVAFTCTEHFGRAMAEKLKEVATYNPNLKIGKGWILSNAKYPKLQELMTQVAEAKVKGEVVYEYNRRRSICLPEPLAEPPIISSFKNIMSLLNDDKSENASCYKSGEQMFIWGNKEKVYETVFGMGKTIQTEFAFNDQCIVLC